MPVSARGEVSRIAEYAIGTPHDQMRRPGIDSASTSWTDVLFLRLLRRDRLHRPFTTLADLGALPTGEKTIK